MIVWDDPTELERRQQEAAREVDEQIASKPVDPEKVARGKAIAAAFDRAGGVPAGFFKVTAVRVRSDAWRVNIYTKTETSCYIPSISISHSSYVKD